MKINNTPITNVNKIQHNNQIEIKDNLFNLENIDTSSFSGPIEIKNNSMFSLFANGGGNGSPQSPWIIENLTIIYDNSSVTLIKIYNTTDHFIIRNCTLIGAGSAIVLSDAPNGIIQNNTIRDIYYSAIYVYGDSENVTIKWNKISNSIKNVSVACILVDYSKNVSIISNEIFNNTNYGEAGIKYRDASNGIISSNIIHDNVFDGIAAAACDDVIITNNTIYNNYWGLYPQVSTNIKIFYNQIYNNIIGIRATGIANYSICFNTIYNNSEMGMDILGINNLNISYNNFIENKISDFNSKSKPIEITDCNGIINFNYYHSHREPDGDNDGIVDSPFIININNIDYNPSANYFNYSNINYLSRVILKRIVNESKCEGAVQGNINLSWQEAIYYGPPTKITYSIWLSNNSGSSWTRISNFIENTTILLNSNSYQDGFYLLKIATNNSLDQSTQIIIENITILNNFTPPKIIKPEPYSMIKEFQYFEWTPAQSSLFFNFTYYLYFKWDDIWHLAAKTNLTYVIVNTSEILDNLAINIEFYISAVIDNTIKIDSEVIAYRTYIEIALIGRFILPSLIILISIGSGLSWKKRLRKISRDFDF
ncbi:MAG: right-handed parallel beta-helix repeat-containing protein [Promethearchaeota archaeon]